MNIKKMKYKKDFIIYYKGEEPSQKLIDKAIFYLRNSNNADPGLVKKGNGREVFKANVSSESYYFKKYSYRSFDKKIKSFFRNSSAFRALKISRELISKGIPVVEPVIAVDYKQTPIFIDSIYISKDFRGENLQNFLANAKYTDKNKKKIIVELSKLWGKLYKNKYINGDPNLPGVLLKFDDSLQLSFVDVDNFHKLIYLSKKRIIRNLAKFNAHSYSGLGKMGGKKLTNKDRKLFLDNIINLYKNFDFNSMSQMVENETLNILKNWDKENLFKRCN